MQGLIADIGGTNARFAIVDAGGIVHEQTLPTQDYDDIKDAVQDYLAQSGAGESIKHACFAIAGPVRGDWFEMSNFKWKFSIEQTGKALGFAQFEVMNDFEAVAIAVPHIPPEDYRKIGRAGHKQTEANMVVMGPGTGLGSAGIVWKGGDYMPVPSESQHAPFGSRVFGDREKDVFEAVMKVRPDYTELSAERVCSGKGLVNLYQAMELLAGNPDAEELAAEEISARAIDGSCELCKEALDMMLEIMGRFAGSLAMTFCAYGGVYIAGGIPLKLGDYFEQSSFREGFEMGGHFNGFTMTIPTYLITLQNPAFLGLYEKMRQMLRAR